MPIYEYVCKSCGHPFEAFVQGSQVPQCPECESADLTKRLSVFAVGGSGAKASPLPPST